MRDRGRKEPLYRKVNTQTHRVRHHTGGDYRSTRRAEAEAELSRTSMHGKTRRGLDYTPLFRFLLSRVGREWNEVYSEVIPRLDRPDPIFWLVARYPEEAREMVCTGESTFYTGMFIDEDGILRLVNPKLRAADLEPFCGCCTHTLNGTRFGKRYKPPMD